MPTQTVETSGSQTISQFQTVVQQQEGIFGPLTALGKDKGGTNNTITMEIGDAPINRAELVVFQGVNPPSKHGYVLVCWGDCLVEGKPARVAAYRRI